MKTANSHQHAPHQATPGAQPGKYLTFTLGEESYGIPVLKVVIQVVAGRNIAVLVEAAVRNTILQMRGIDTYQDFMQRQRLAMGDS